MTLDCVEGDSFFFFRGKIILKVGNKESEDKLYTFED